MAVAKKVGSWAIGLLAAWVIALAIFGSLYGSRAGQRVAARVADKLGAQVTIESTNLSMVRGLLAMSGFKVRKDDLGKLEIDVGEIDCELPPLGLLLLDRTCKDLVIDRVRFSATSLAVFQLTKSKRKPLRADHVVIRDAVLAFSPSAFVPELGRIEVKVDEVEAGPTTFKTPLSWIFSMRALTATVALPAGVVVKLRYANGNVTAAGSVFGSTPITVPLAIPMADPADDARAELARLVPFARDLAERLVARRAQDWLRSKISF